jgi:hypothetical protein
LLFGALLGHYPEWNAAERSLMSMLGFLFNDRECRELNYMLRKELDEMLFDLKDPKMSSDIKSAIESRYNIIFRMFARLASQKEISRYARNKSYQE